MAMHIRMNNAMSIFNSVSVISILFKNEPPVDTGRFLTLKNQMLEKLRSIFWNWPL